MRYYSLFIVSLPCDRLSVKLLQHFRLLLLRMNGIFLLHYRAYCAIARPLLISRGLNGRSVLCGFAFMVRHTNREDLKKSGSIRVSALDRQSVFIRQLAGV